MAPIISSEIKDPSFKKKLFFSAIGVLLLAGFVVAWLVLHNKEMETAKEEVKKKTEGESQEKLEKLKEVESAIERTKKELETLSTLSPEEKAERQRKRNILSARKETSDVAIEGVEIMIKGAKKIMVNKKEGYQIEMPSNFLIARSVASDWIELHDKQFMCQDQSCEPVMRIRVQARNTDELSIGEWLGKEEERAGASIYSPREQITIGQESAYRVSEEIPARFEGYYYYWGKGKKIYDMRISVFDDETYRPYIHTFSFLAAP